MKFHKQDIDGVWLIETEPVVDSRGAFHRHFCSKEFERTGLPFKIVQTNISENKKKHTLRGFHYQVAPEIFQKQFFHNKNPKESALGLFIISQSTHQIEYA